MNTHVSLLLSSLAVAGCSDSGSERSSVQLLEVETSIQNGGSTAIERLAFSYEGSQLREIARHDNGAPAGTARFTYGAGGITAIEYSDSEGDRATEQLTYEGGRLVRSRYEIPGNRVDERTLAYDANGTIKEVSTLSTIPGFSSSTSLVRYEYDSAGHVAKQLQIAGSENASTELHYTADGTIERASMFEGGAHRETFTFEVVDGRLGEVVDSRNGRHEVTYDDEGRVAEVRHSTSNGTTTSRYTYGSGSISGWTFAPAVPVPQLFDLTGTAYDTVSPLHGDVVIPNDLPRAVTTDPDPDPDPDPTCSFTPTNDCETCLATSCCSETEACFVNTPCDQYYQCMTGCTDAQCQAVCGETNPTGKSDLESLQSCGQAFCPTSCGS